MHTGGSAQDKQAVVHGDEAKTQEEIHADWTPPEPPTVVLVVGTLHEGARAFGPYKGPETSAHIERIAERVSHPQHTGNLSDVWSVIVLEDPELLEEHRIHEVAPVVLHEDGLTHEEAREHRVDVPAAPRLEWKLVEVAGEG